MIYNPNNTATISNMVIFSFIGMSSSGGHGGAGVTGSLSHGIGCAKTWSS